MPAIIPIRVPARVPPPFGLAPDLGHPHCEGLVGWWLCHDAGAERVSDISGYENHGILTNMDPATDWEFRHDTKARAHTPTLRTSGTTEHALISSFNVNLGSRFTFMCRGIIHDTSLAFDEDCAASIGEYVSDHYMQLKANGGSTDAASRWEFRCREVPSFKNVGVVGDTQFTVNTWYHVAGTSDGTNIYIHENGVKQSGSTAFGEQLDAFTNSYIGHSHTGFSSFQWDGNVWDVRVFNRELSESEIHAIAFNPFAPFRK